MDAMNMLIQVPSWAYDFCYYYLAVAAVIAVFSVYTIAKLFMLPSLVKKVIPTTMVALSLLLSGGVSIILTMMQFWICRSALAPRVMKEKFAVACNNTGDCLAVAGTQPAGSLCTCGDRGLCAGCTMNSNMEPSMLPEYNMPLAGIKEGFRAHAMSGLLPRRK